MEYYVAILSIVLVVGIRIFLRWLRKNDDYWKKRGIPYQPRMSLLSMIKTMTTKPFYEYTLEGYKKHGKLYGEFVNRKPLLIVSEPDLLRDILVKDFHVFNYRKDQKIEPMMDQTVFSMKGEDWKRVRTIITPAFTSKKMRQMSHIINESCKIVVENFEKHAESGQPADIKKIFGAFTMDVIASAAFATKIDSHNDPENIFVRHVKNGFGPNSVYQFFILVLLPVWITKRLPLPILNSFAFFKDVILKVIGERKLSNKKFNDILQLLLDAQEELEKGTADRLDEPDESDQYGSVANEGALPRMKYNKLAEDELVAQCVMFFVVGYETTAATLAFLAYCLATNQECQDKLIKEIDGVYQKHKEINHDVIRDMKYLDCLISETLRMYPIIPRGERTSIEDYKLGNTGVVLEKGTFIGFNIHAMHHDPEFFADPEKFYPERFLPENMNHPQYAYLPFGAGPRNCLGMRFALMEMKLCLSTILRHYRFKVGPTTKVPLEFKPGMFTSAEIELMIEKRAKYED